MAGWPPHGLDTVPSHHRSVQWILTSVRMTAAFNPNGSEKGQIEKLDPQPQPEAACGFSTLKAAPPSDST